jgi:toxin ParE1/3/4
MHPYLGRPGRVANTRELVVTSTPFIVAYRVVSDRIEILAVFHGARRWPDSF